MLLSARKKIEAIRNETESPLELVSPAGIEPAISRL